MRVDYSDPDKRHYLLMKIKLDIQGRVEEQLDELQDDSLVGSKYTSALGEILDYLDDKLTIEFND